MSFVPNDKTLGLTLFTLKCISNDLKLPLGTLVLYLSVLVTPRSLNRIRKDSDRQMLLGFRIVF